MKGIVANAVDRILADVCSPAIVRVIEGGADHTLAWQALEESGFLDALVPEEAGGAGLAFADASVIVELTGRHAVPLPIGETLLLRGLLNGAGVTAPKGSMTFGRRPFRSDGKLECINVPCGRIADWVLVEDGPLARLLPTSTATREAMPFAIDCSLSWTSAEAEAGQSIDNVGELDVVEALVRSLQLSGALYAVLKRTLDYANERQQFGKPIGRFQAIQHMLAVMAEHVVAARMAAELAAPTSDLAFDPLRVAIAKARTSEAAAEVAALSHAVHGAMGFTAEYDLQLWTRRLHAWRQAAGAEGYWQHRVGAMLLSTNFPTTLDLLRQASESS